MLEIVHEFEKLQIMEKNKELELLIANKPKVVHIPVKYIRAINPWGEEVLVSEKDMKTSETLGLGLRRIEDE